MRSTLHHEHLLWKTTCMCWVTGVLSCLSSPSERLFTNQNHFLKHALFFLIVYIFILLQEKNNCKTATCDKKSTLSNLFVAVVVVVAGARAHNQPGLVHGTHFSFFFCLFVSPEVSVFHHRYDGVVERTLERKGKATGRRRRS